MARVSSQARAFDQVFVLGLRCEAVLKNTVTPYLPLTPRQFGWQRGASVTVLNNGILSLENLMQGSLSPFPTAGVSFRQRVRQLFVRSVTQEPLLPAGVKPSGSADALQAGGDGVPGSFF